MLIGYASDEFTRFTSQQNAASGFRKSTRSLSVRLKASDLPSFWGKVVFPCSRRTKATREPAKGNYICTQALIVKEAYNAKKLQRNKYFPPLVSCTQHIPPPKQCAEARAT